MPTAGHDAFRAVNNQVGVVGELGTSAEPLQTARPRKPSARRRATVRNAARSPRSSPTNSTQRLDELGKRPALVDTWRSQLEDESAELQAGRGGPRRRRGRGAILQTRRADQRRDGCEPRTTGPCPRSRRPPEARGRRPPSGPGRFPDAPTGMSPRGRRVPALGAVVTEDEQPVDGRQPVQAGVLHGERGRSAGDDRHRPDALTELTHPAPRESRACAGSATIGASVPSKSRPTSARAGSARSAARPALPSAVVGTGRLISPLYLGVLLAQDHRQRVIGHRRHPGRTRSMPGNAADNASAALSYPAG